MADRKREIELLKDYIKELEARLAKYENAHTPPSLRRGRNHRKDQNSREYGKPGRKLGHEGVTRPQAKPDKQVEVTADQCPVPAAIEKLRRKPCYNP